MGNLRESWGVAVRSLGLHSTYKVQPPCEHGGSSPRVHKPWAHQFTLSALRCHVIGPACLQHQGRGRLARAVQEGGRRRRIKGEEKRGGGKRSKAERVGKE